MPSRAPIRPAWLRRTPAPYRFGVVVAVLAGVILLNLLQIPFINSHVAGEMKTLRYDTSDIAAFTYRTCPSSRCSQRYGMYLALAVVAPGARVYIPTPSFYQTPTTYADDVATKMYTFGRAASVSWVPSPAAAGPGIDPSRYVLASGPGGAWGTPWLLAVDPSRMPPGPRGNPDDYLTDVVTGEGPTHSTPVRSFVLIHWQQPRAGSTYPYQDLLVEASVLPPRLRAGLA